MFACEEVAGAHLKQKYSEQGYHREMTTEWVAYAKHDSNAAKAYIE